MMQPRKVRASNMSATYDAGVFCTETDAEAVAQAREKYRDSSLGRALKDTGAFHFYVAGRGAEAYARSES
jgi:hypothetical protein